MQSLEILAKLLALDSVSSQLNIDLMAYIKDLPEAAGAEVAIIFDPSGGKANLFVTVGLQRGGGGMLSGHTDVVPVEGQTWTFAPLAMTLHD